ncbi:MAG: DEAD/DEAH box helicase [Spirochaetaceae bacterium]|nr:DEAD/DEAH box helicase [Spirochaetaceae bacterium]
MDQNDAPKRRGRPPRAAPAPGLDAERDFSEQVGARAFFRLSGAAGDYRLDLVDGRGKPVAADYRRFGAQERAAVREFAARLAEEADRIRWDSGEALAPDDRTVSADPSLLEAAGAAEMLVDEELRPLELVSGERSLVLAIEEAGPGVLRARLGIEEGADAADAADAAEASARPRVVSPRHATLAGRLYSLRELGPEWRAAAELASSFRTESLPVFLSLALSRFSNLELRCGGYVAMSAPSRVARPALVFSDVDEYGYLHVRPVSSLEPYPPGFFEDNEITKIAEIDEEEKRLLVSELLFPVFADEEFRRILAAKGKAAKQAVFEESGFFILAPDFAASFLSESLSELMRGFVLYESERLASFKLKPVRPKLKLNLPSGIDFLSGRIDVEIDGETFPYSGFLEEYRKASFVTLSDGTRAYPDRREMARLERLIKVTSGGDAGVSFFDYPVLARGEGVEAEGEAWKRPESFYRGFNGIAQREASFAVEGAALRPYQEYGVRWMDYLREHSLSGCLADEMGLGKTIQTIALLRSLYARGERRPSLVVMPKSLLFNWKNELARFAPELGVLVHYGTERDAALLPGAQVILTSYAVLRIDFEAFSGIEYCHLVLDEAQAVKNAVTKTNKAVRGLQAAHRLALSGTPVENDLGELHALFGFLNPGMFESESDFSKRYLRPIQERGDELALRDLKARVYPFILRRLKREVLPELPEKTEQVVYVELESDHLAFYHRRRMELKAEIDAALGSGSPAEFAKARFRILQALTELRRIASVPEAEGAPVAVSAKREYLKEAVAEIVENGHKCLVFANYLAAVDAVSEDLGALGLDNLVMTGATVDRASLVRRFQSDASIKAFIMTLKTGGLGLNLTAADYVFIFDPWWNRGAEAQAIDRTHRMGQRNPVFCYRLIAKDTIEERILELQERKESLVSSLISSDADAYKALDENDIAYLLE